MLFVRCFCAVWNKTNLVLSVFSDNLLAQSHSCTLQSSLLIQVTVNFCGNEASLNHQQRGEDLKLRMLC